MAEAAALSGKTVVVGVTGGIAAYKSAEIIRWLKQEGAVVVVVMTPAARRFVSPLTLETLSGNPVVTSLWRAAGNLDVGSRPPGRRSPVEHVEIADAADLVLVTPATADFLARVSLGLASDALTSTLLATRAPVVLAPAMNVQMWNHPATREHVARLRARAAVIVEPEEGELACRWEGKGRLAGIEGIAAAVRAVLGRAQSLAGRRVVVSAGPTREALDPVRYLSNFSSGKMGFAVAEAARDRGAQVTLVSGPVAETPPAGVTVVAVTSAEEMRRAVHTAARGADAVVMAAAVADFRPARASRSKIPRTEGGWELRLEPTPDILAGIPRKSGRVIVGFALETGDGIERARSKIEEKGCDLMVLNDPTREDSAFGGETSRVTLIGRRGRPERLPTLAKREVGERIWDRVEKLWAAAARKRPRRAQAKTAARTRRRSSR